MRIVWPTLSLACALACNRPPVVNDSTQETGSGETLGDEPDPYPQCLTNLQWGSPVLLQEPHELTLSGPSAAFSDNWGNTVVGWSPYGGDGPYSVSKFSAAGESWGPTIPLGPDHSYSAAWLGTAGRDGTFILRADTNPDILIHRLRPSADEWTEHPTEQVVPGRHHGNDLVLDADGNALAVISSYREPNFEVWSLRLDAAADEWSDVQRLDSLDYEPGVELVMDPEGRATAVWWGSNGEGHRMAELAAGASSWTEVPAAHQPDGLHATVLDMVTDGSGNLTLLMSEELNQIFAQRRPAGGEWQDAVVIAPQTQGANKRYARLVALGETGALIVWALSEEVYLPYSSIYASVFTQGEWSEPEAIADDLDNYPGLVLASDDCGRAVAAWSSLLGEPRVVTRSFDRGAGQWAPANTIYMSSGVPGPISVGLALK